MSLMGEINRASFKRDQIGMRAKPVRTERHINETPSGSYSELPVHRTNTVLDHPDNSVTDEKIGSRTIDDSNIPTGDTGLLSTLLDFIGYMIKIITGELNWRTAPAITLKATKSHVDDISIHHNTTWVPMTGPDGFEQVYSEDGDIIMVEVIL